MKIMIVTRPAPLVLLNVVLASLHVVCLTTASMASETTDQSPSVTATEATSQPRRSHIQSVGEVAAASRHSETLGLRLARASEVLRQQLALARGAGLVVEEVTPGSTADKAGFRQHDVLVLLDDQMLLLPEQLAALLESSNGNATPECTLLRGGAKVTITIGELRPTDKPTLSTPSNGGGTATVAVTPVPVPAPVPARPQPPAVRQTAAKPSASPRLRAPASALALVQPDRSVQQPQATLQTSATVPASSTSPAQPAGRQSFSTDETLVRHDPDYQIKLSRGNETRLVILDPHGRIVFNDEIDTTEHRRLVPQAVRQRVEEMEKSLENVANGPPAQIGRLDVSPIEIR
jgi:hypothetical protein